MELCGVLVEKHAIIITMIEQEHEREKQIGKRLAAFVESLKHKSEVSTDGS